MDGRRYVPENCFSVLQGRETKKVRNSPESRIFYPGSGFLVAAKGEAVCVRQRRRRRKDEVSEGAQARTFVRTI